MTDFDPDLLHRLSELERREWLRLHKSPWFNQLESPIKQFVNANPPHYLYRVKDTDELAYIQQYHSDKNDIHSQMLEIMIDIKYNPKNLTNKLVLIAPEAIERVKLRSVADAEQLIAEDTRRNEMAELANRHQSLVRTRAVEKEAFVDLAAYRAAKAAGKTLHPITDKPDGIA